MPHTIVPNPAYRKPGKCTWNINIRPLVEIFLGGGTICLISSRAVSDLFKGFMNKSFQSVYEQIFPKCLGTNLSKVFMISPQLNSFLGSPLSKQSSQCWVNQTSATQTGTSSHSPGLCYTRHQVPGVGLTRPLLHISFTRPLSLVIDLQQWTKKKKILPCSQREVL